MKPITASVNLLVGAAKADNNSLILDWLHGKAIFDIVHAVALASEQAQTFPRVLIQTVYMPETDDQAEIDANMVRRLNAERCALVWARKLGQLDQPSEKQSVAAFENQTNTLATLTNELAQIDDHQDAMAVISGICECSHCRKLVLSHVQWLLDNPENLSN